ncbi:Nucleic acid-binding [Forsythia ovata]|uniref:Nucleic acid-binding n=1 Tax=Forsythia ovata TaxID=205694 RepID=A0ABD1T6F9_9LAMI
MDRMKSLGILNLSKKLKPESKRQIAKSPSHKKKPTRDDLPRHSTRYPVTLFSNVIGIVITVRQPLSIKVEKNTTRNTNKKEITLIDGRSNTIKVALWGDLANNEGQILSDKVSENPVVILSNVKGSFYQAGSSKPKEEEVNVYLVEKLKRRHQVKERHSSYEKNVGEDRSRNDGISPRHKCQSPSLPILSIIAENGDIPPNPVPSPFLGHGGINLEVYVAQSRTYVALTYSLSGVYGA